jgi:hypothetical protein
LLSGAERRILDETLEADLAGYGRIRYPASIELKEVAVGFFPSKNSASEVAFADRLERGLSRTRSELRLVASRPSASFWFRRSARLFAVGDLGVS